MNFLLICEIFIYYFCYIFYIVSNIFIKGPIINSFDFLIIHSFFIIKYQI